MLILQPGKHSVRAETRRDVSKVTSHICAESSDVWIWVDEVEGSLSIRIE